MKIKDLNDVLEFSRGKYCWCILYNYKDGVENILNDGSSFEYILMQYPNVYVISIRPVYENNRSYLLIETTTDVIKI